MLLRIRRQADGRPVADRVRVADTFWSRFRGLMMSAPLPTGDGLLLEPCSSIHMLFMRCPINVAFLAANDMVVACYHSLPPWTGLSGWHRDACKVVELPAGTLARTEVTPGTQLTLERID
ncbi:hypothetical protein AUK22_04840 [bacterium CG2_30_54_10]|nr:MAG: hypothetical protein AUK22_04840 [bacterium CG2_30_54_10]